MVTTTLTRILHTVNCYNGRDGIICMDGVIGGSNEAILCQFDSLREDNTAYSKYIDECMTKTRLIEINRVIKLCDNEAALQRGDANYDPTYKYNYRLCTIRMPLRRRLALMPAETRSHTVT